MTRPPERSGGLSVIVAASQTLSEVRQRRSYHQEPRLFEE